MTESRSRLSATAAMCDQSHVLRDQRAGLRMGRRTYLLLSMVIGAVAGLLVLQAIPGQHNWLDAKLAMGVGVILGYGVGRMIGKDLKDSEREKE